MLKLGKLIVSTLLVLVFFSCRKETEKPTWDVDLLAPLLKTTLSLEDLLVDSIVQSNTDNSLKIVFETELFDLNPDSLVQIPDTSITEFFSVPVTLTANPGNNFYSNDEEIDFNVKNGVELNFAKIESGFIEIEVFSDIEEKIIVEYFVPSATKNGDTLVLEEIIDAATPSQQGYLKKIIDLSGYDMDLTGISGVEVNTIYTKAHAIIDTLGAPVLIDVTDLVVIYSQFVDIVPFYAKGYFGSQNVHFGPETTTTDAFDWITNGTIDLEQADVNFNIKNGIGVDAQIIFNQLETQNTHTATNVSLNHSMIGSSVNVNRAQETNSMPEVSYANNYIDINTTNSNIDQLLEVLPNQFLYELDLAINPFGNISGSNDFFYKNHPIEANLNVEIPLSFAANNLTLVDTISVSLSDDNSSSGLLGGSLFLYAENGYPFDAGIELELYDANMNFIKKLTTIDQFLAAPVDAALKVTQKRASRITIPLSTSDIGDLFEAKKIVISLSFTTTAQPQFVKIYNNYKIDLKVVGDFGYTVNFNN